MIALEAPRLVLERGAFALERGERSLERRPVAGDPGPYAPDRGCEQRLDVPGSRRSDPDRGHLLGGEHELAQRAGPVRDGDSALRPRVLRTCLGLLARLPGNREALGGGVQRRARPRRRGGGDPHHAPKLALAHEHRPRAVREVADGVAPGDRRKARRKLVAQGRGARRQAGGPGEGVDVIEPLAASAAASSTAAVAVTSCASPPTSSAAASVAASRRAAAVARSA